MTRTGAIILLTTLAALTVSHVQAAPSSQSKTRGYNVLFIGGNPQVKTPNLDRFARDGGIVFSVMEVWIPLAR